VILRLKTARERSRGNDRRTAQAFSPWRSKGVPIPLLRNSLQTGGPYERLANMDCIFRRDTGARLAFLLGL
jgi:hypothetical protein